MARRFQALCVFVGIAAGMELTCLGGGAMLADQSVDNANRFITLSTPPKEYLLGEPVVLQVVVTNFAQGELVVGESFPGGIEPEIAVYINGERFKYGYPNDCWLWDGPKVSLKRREAWTYTLRVAASRAHPAAERIQLAFEKPGIYEIKSGWPRVTGLTPEQIRKYGEESNTIKVVVKEPTDVDAKVWQRLQRIPSVPSGLQWHEGPYVEHARELIALLEEFPDTGYRDSFRSGLRRFYFSQRSKVSLDERAKIRQLTGITDPYEFKDPRLNAKMELPLAAKALKVHDSSVELRLGALFDMLRQQSGVVLEASPYLKRRTVSVWTKNVPGWGKVPQDLHGYMDLDSVTDKLNAWWVKRGDGYVLVCDDEETFKNLAEQKRDK